MELLQNWFPQRETEEIIKLQWPAIECQDKILWTASDDGAFSVKSCHNLMSHQGGVESTSGIWKNIWKANLHERSMMFLWRIASNVLPTREVIWRRIQTGERSCGLCGEEQETSMHLFFKCPFARVVVFSCKWGIRLDSWNCSNVEDLVLNCLNPPREQCGHQMTGEEITTILVAVMEEIWMTNAWIHESKRDVVESARKIERRVSEQEGNNGRRSNGELDRPTLTSTARQGWTASARGWIAINIGAATNQGKNALAMVARDDQGNIMYMAAKIVTGLAADIS